MAYAPPPVEDFGGWYLRGDIGVSNQRVERLNNVLDAGLTTQTQNLTLATLVSSASVSVTRSITGSALT
jgi:hypothetical protein